MPISKKPRKKYRPGQHAACLADRLIYHCRMNGKSTEGEIISIAESAYRYLDGMKTRPNEHGYLQLVDITNILSVVIGNSSSPRWRKIAQCPEMQSWLVEIGYDNVAQTVIDAHQALIDAGERAKRTGSFALDGRTFSLMENIIAMFFKCFKEINRKTMASIIQYCVKAHKPAPDGKSIRITHLDLSPRFAEIESSWVIEDLPEEEAA